MACCADRGCGYFSFLKIPVAEIRNRDLIVEIVSIGGILACDKGAKLDRGVIARVLDGHDFKAREIDAAAFPFRY